VCSPSKASIRPIDVIVAIVCDDSGLEVDDMSDANTAKMNE
jgi:hypothetical protein